MVVRVAGVSVAWKSERERVVFVSARCAAGWTLPVSRSRSCVAPVWPVDRGERCRQAPHRRRRRRRRGRRGPGPRFSGPSDRSRCASLGAASRAEGRPEDPGRRQHRWWDLLWAARVSKVPPCRISSKVRTAWDRALSERKSLSSEISSLLSSMIARCVYYVCAHDLYGDR